LKGQGVKFDDQNLMSVKILISLFKVIPKWVTLAKSFTLHVYLKDIEKIIRNYHKLSLVDLNSTFGKQVKHLSSFDNLIKRLIAACLELSTDDELPEFKEKLKKAVEGPKADEIPDEDTGDSKKGENTSNSNQDENRNINPDSQPLSPFIKFLLCIVLPFTILSLLVMIIVLIVKRK
jgi:hypothetical protein